MTAQFRAMSRSRLAVLFSPRPARRVSKLVSAVTNDRRFASTNTLHQSVRQRGATRLKSGHLNSATRLPFRVPAG